MQELLYKIVSELQKIKSPVLAYLQPGVSKLTYEKKLNSFHLTPSDEFISLYQWHNGTAEMKTENSNLWLFPGGIFLPIDKALEIYQYHTISNNTWDKTLFPIFADGGGDFYLINMSSQSPNHGRIYYFSFNAFDFDQIISYFDSVQSTIETIIEWYQQKAFILNYFGDPVVTFDSEKQLHIALKNNPNSDYWKMRRYLSINAR
jgi:hypothetical protein